MSRVQDADWENNWKQFYKPMEIGERLLVIPEWETASVPGRTELRLNPGLTFGTGSHATTPACVWPRWTAIFVRRAGFWIWGAAAVFCPLPRC